MWLLAGVRQLRALRMSHRFTFFTLPTALCRFLLGWLGVFVFCVFCLVVFGSVFCFSGFGSGVLHVQQASF